MTRLIDITIRKKFAFPMVACLVLCCQLKARADSGSAPSIADKSRPILIAAGQGMRTPGPVPTQPISPVSPDISTPTETPPSIPEGLYPPGPPTEQPGPSSPATGTIEYDEALAPKSNVPGLSIVQALNEALIKGPRAAAIRSQFAIARANYPAATQMPNSVFFFDRGMVAEQVNRIGPVSTFEPPWKLIYRLLVAKRLIAQTKIDLMTQLWSLRHDVRSAYVEVVVAQETQKTLLDLYDLASRLRFVSDKRFHAGDVPELDALKARLATSKAEVDVGVGSKRVIRARQQINILMGRETESAVNVPGLPSFIMKEAFKLRIEKNDILPDFSKEPAPLSKFIEAALANRLELKSLAQQVKVNSANLGGAYGGAFPNPSLAYGKSQQGNPPPGPKLTAVFFTLNAEMPMVNFNQGSIYQYKATSNQLKYQIGSQKNQVMSDVTSAYQNLLAAREKIRVYQGRLLADSEEVARLARRSYEVGQSDITSTLQAQQANIAVRSAYLDAVNAYASAFTDLEFAVGKPLQY